MGKRQSRADHGERRKSGGEKGERKVTNCAQDRKTKQNCPNWVSGGSGYHWAGILLGGALHIFSSSCAGATASGQPRAHNPQIRVTGQNFPLRSEFGGEDPSRLNSSPRLPFPTGQAELIILIIILTNFFLSFPSASHQMLAQSDQFLPNISCVHISSFSLLPPT